MRLLGNKYHQAEFNQTKRTTLEERFFNKTFTKNVNGGLRRCGEFIFKEPLTVGAVTSDLDDHMYAVKSALKRIIGQAQNLPLLGKSKKAVSVLCGKFRRDVLDILTETSPVGERLKSKDIHAVRAVFITYSPDPTGLEGVFHIELVWYADTIVDGKDRSFLIETNNKCSRLPVVN